MKWLILSNKKNESKKISDTIRLRDKACPIEAYTLSKADSEKWMKNLYSVTNVVVLAEKEDLASLDKTALFFSLSGYCSRGNVPLFTNLSELQKFPLGNSDVIRFFKTADLIQKEISDNYVFILKNAKKEEAAKSLLNKGIPFTVDCFGDYISKGKFEICRQFITAGMDINSRDNLGTPMLNIAVRTDNEEIVSWMIDNGAEINVSSEDRGYTPLMDAVWRGNKEITKFLIENNAEVNTICKEGQSNLVIAVGAGKTDIVRLLAENGADPDVKDAMGMSAYDYAVLFKKDDITKILFPYHKIPD